MFCTKCGTQNADNAKFCINCGSPLHSQPVEPEIVQPKREASPNGSKIIPEKDLLNTLTYVALGAAVVVWLVAISAGFGGINMVIFGIILILIVCDGLRKNKLGQAKISALFCAVLNGVYALINFSMLLQVNNDLKTYNVIFMICEITVAVCLGYLFYKLNQVKS
ncbi:MAG: zinc-ribbon domain-containing protein [Microcystis wesenbergii Mw_QC_B_20070930_S4]|jgi:hypothetical protein|nr:MAG: zinc-ribbon domain-containing protein [Microcystis wesenbergii Mw_QC_B_20070930_S4D]TRV17513.1 MAG: zinc-ribbon domain-containing protein [Microcystis wesenbergii Mw_QC_B_20070930_S4]